MLNLFNYLTELDNKRIENYIKKWGCEDYIGNSIYLQDWANSNKKLFHLFGGHLILKKQISIEKNDDILTKDMESFFHEPEVDEFFEYISDSISEEILKLPRDERWDKFRNSDAIVNISVESLVKNEIKENIVLNWREDKKPVKLNRGTRLMKAIKKTLDYINAYPEIYEEFENIRIKHSMVLNDKILRGVLCLSIHPLDFLTMSDNDMNWESCMSWINDGCYHAGTVEMMNSNCVICAYLESENSNFNMLKLENKDNLTEDQIWNNKKWRQLFYCTKDILLSGKSYPYKAKDLTFEVLRWLNELAKENWNRTYEYGIEEYKDMKHINSNFKMEKNKNWIRSKQQSKHNILVDTKIMYNDIFNDSYTTYYCYRNKVKSNIVLNLSGKIGCVCCGDNDFRVKVRDLTDEDIDYYNCNGDDIDIDDIEWTYNEQYVGTKRVMCMPCYIDHFCNCCRGENRSGRAKTVRIKEEDLKIIDRYRNIFDINEYHICKKCFTENFVYCPTCNNIFYLDWHTKEYLTLGLYPETFASNDAYRINRNHDLHHHWYREEKESKYKEKMMLFRECFDCAKIRRENSHQEMIHDDNDKEGYYYGRTKVWIYNKPVDPAEMVKYRDINLIHLTEKDFEDYCAGMNFKDIQERYKKFKNI